MLFHEIYGSYYRVTASALREAVKGTLTPRALTELVRSQAFSESYLAIPQGLQGERWRLTRRDLTTPIAEAPTMPLTTLQKRWLKALLSDPRIRLFAPDTRGLEDVEPLFTPDMFVYFDRYTDGDDYADPGYIERFRTILRALRERQDLYVRFRSARGQDLSMTFTPQYLEYSEKDDRFRLVTSGQRGCWTINLSRLTHCEPARLNAGRDSRPPETDSVVLELRDERNALERALLHFSHLRKETERLDGNRYRLTLYYNRQDETEMVIRVLSFGPMVRAIGPGGFVERIRARIERQRRLARVSPEKAPSEGKDAPEDAPPVE